MGTEEGLCPFKRVLKEEQSENPRDEGQMASKQDGSELGRGPAGPSALVPCSGKDFGQWLQLKIRVRAGPPDPGPSEWSHWPHLLRVLDPGGRGEATEQAWSVRPHRSGFKASLCSLDSVVICWNFHFLICKSG